MESTGSAFIIMILLGVVSLYLGIKPTWKASKASKDWSTASGVIKKSEVGENQRYDDGEFITRYTPNVGYEYQVGGIIYEGKRISFGSAEYSKGKARKIAESFPVGLPVIVLYDPQNPSQSVIEAKAKGVLFYILAGIILIVLGVIRAF